MTRIVPGINFLLLFISCNSFENEYAGNNNLKNAVHLCIYTDDVLGWNIVGDVCQAYAKDDLYGPIDGGADLYVKNGLVEFSLYTMADSLNDTVEIFVCNMGTSKNAVTIFSHAKHNLHDSLSLKNYDGSTAVIGLFALGTVYELHATLGCFYFLLTFKQIADNGKAIEVSETFLDVIQTKLR